MGKIIDRITPLIIIGFFIGLPIMLCWDKNNQEQNDYNEHKQYINKNIVLNNDTVQVLEWRTGRFDKNRGYVLSNGLTVDELIVYKNVINNE